MPTILLALIPLAAFALIMGTAIGWDRLREPHRDPTKPFVVVDRRTYRDAQRRIDRVLPGDPFRARVLMHAICVWLRSEVQAGRRSRRVQYAADLEQWELRLEQTAPMVGLV